MKRIKYIRLGLTLIILLSGAISLNAQTLNERPSSRHINDDILFSPEFHAYKHGRLNNAKGEGEQWYKRFTVMHISDIHSSHSQLQEALEVAAQKADIVVNTGDDAHGKRAKDSSFVNEVLLATTATVRGHNTLPYLQVPGNHDVTGISKRDYFIKVCNVIQNYCPKVEWGNPQGYRTYGYADFINAPLTGNFRVIMLDPFDYDDTQFENPYKYMSAVFSQKQIDWLVDALVDAASKGYHVITMMHYPFGDAEVFNEQTANPDALFYQDPFMIPQIIDAIQNRKKISGKYKDLSGLQDIVVDRDFSDVGELDFVAHLFGHIHSKNDYQCQESDGTKYDILMLGEAAIGRPGTAVNKIYMEKGTVNDIAFSALHIDVIEKVIYRVSYGAYRSYDMSAGERSKKISYRFPASKKETLHGK